MRRDPEAGKRLKEVMAARGVAPGDLAEAMQVAKSTVSRWRRGELPDDENVARLAAILRTSTNWLKEARGSRDGPERPYSLDQPSSRGAAVREAPEAYEVRSPESAIRLQVVAKAMGRLMLAGDVVPRLLALQALDEVSTAWAGEEARRSAATVRAAAPRNADDREESPG